MDYYSKYYITVLAVLAIISPCPIYAQTLYGVTFTTRDLVTLDATNGSTITTIAPLSAGNGVGSGRAIAMNPITGDMYAIHTNSGNANWFLATLNLATGAYTDIADMNPERLRDITFDDTGKLWGVTSSSGPNPHSLVSVNLLSGASTLENGALPTTQNRIAYDPQTDTLYIQGARSGNGELYSLSPSAPNALTTVTLSGASIPTSGQPPMVFDPINDVLILKPAGTNWTRITTSGVVTSTTPSFTDTVGGLAFDQATTQIPVELSTFGAE